jgi:hypothetical protein
MPLRRLLGSWHVIPLPVGVLVLSDSALQAVGSGLSIMLTHVWPAAITATAAVTIVI